MRLLAAFIMLVLVVPSAAAAPVGVGVDEHAEGDWLAVSVFGDATSHGHSVSGFGDATSDCSFSGTTLCTVFAPNGDASSGGYVRVGGGYVCVLYCVDTGTSGDNEGAVAFSTDGDATGQFVGVSLDGDATGTVALAPQGSASGDGVSIARDNATSSGSFLVIYGTAVSTEGDARGGLLAFAPNGDARGLVAGSVYGDAYTYDGVGASVFGDVPVHCYSYYQYTWCYHPTGAVSVFGDAQGENTVDGEGVAAYASTGNCSVDGWVDVVLFFFRGCRAGRVTAATDADAEGAWALTVFGDAKGDGCAVWGNFGESYPWPTILPGCVVRSVAVSVFGSADGEAASISGCDLAGLCYDELP